jgi:hypothetical protein
VTDDARARTTDPDGREVIFDDASYRHLKERRAALLEQLSAVN